ncbi:MAG: hypothetical protein ACYC21_06960 [Eubacteriales bacterium]
MFEQYMRKIQADRRGSALVFTLLVTAVLMVLAAAIVSVTGTDSEIVMAREEKTAAQYMAESAMEVIKQRITEAGAVQLVVQMSDWERIPTIANDNGPSSEGEFRYSITQPSESLPNRYTVEIDVRKTAAGRDTVVKNLKVVIEFVPGRREYTVYPGGNTDWTPPPVGSQYIDTTVFDYAVVGGGTLPLTDGSTEIDGPVFSNSSIRLRPGVIKTGNSVKAVGAISSGDGDYRGVSLLPNQPLPLTMPVVDWAYLRDLAQATQNIDEKVTSSVSFTQLDGSKLNPNDVIYVDGNLHITGEIPYNAIIAATGKIIIHGDFKFPFAGAVGLFAGDNINIMSNIHNPDDTEIQGSIRGPQIRGLVIAGNDIIVQGEAKIEGTAIAGNQFQPEKLVMKYKSDPVIQETHDGQETQNTPEPAIPAYDVLNMYGTRIIENYDLLHITTPVPWTPPSGDQTVVVPGKLLPSAIKIIQWEELN